MQCNLRDVLHEGPNLKDIFKEAVKGLIPDEIARRPKEGFVLPIFDWLNAELKDFILDTLSRGRVSRHGYLDAGQVENIVRGYYAGKTADAARVWNLAMFQLWWERYFG